MKNLLNIAIDIALNAHDGQEDKAGENYILHPLRVMMKMKTDKERIVAVLHDVIEDTAITYDFLRKRGFDEEIINAIGSVTKIKNEDYFDFVARAKQNVIGRNVKLADLEDNMDLSRISNPTKKDYERLEKYKTAREILK